MAATVVLILALPLSADEVILKSGASFQGVVSENGDKVVLQIDCGTLTFAKADVREIKKNGSPLLQLEEKIKGAVEAKEYYEIGVWAKERGLTTRANDLFKKTIDRDPEHDGARKALGYVRFEGRWLTPDELMQAQGLVKHEGRWLPKETVAKILEQETQIRIEEERLATAKEIARKQHDLELRRIELERERLELEKKKEEDRGFYPGRCRVVIPPCGCPQGTPIQFGNIFYQPGVIHQNPCPRTAIGNK